jgi:hypothetical protein
MTLPYWHAFYNRYMLTRNRHVHSVMAGRQGLRRNLSVFTRGWAMATHPALCAGHPPLVLTRSDRDHPLSLARASGLGSPATATYWPDGGWTGDMARPSIVNA